MVMSQPDLTHVVGTRLQLTARREPRGCQISTVFITALQYYNILGGLASYGNVYICIRRIANTMSA